MRDVTTGSFSYASDHEFIQDIEGDFRTAYEQHIENAIAILDSGECSAPSANDLLIAVENWETTVDAIKEAGECGGPEGLVGALINSHTLMRDMLLIGIAIGERKTFKSTAKAREKLDKTNAHLSASDRRRILLEVASEVERETIAGSKYKEMAQRCRARGYDIGHEAVRDKLRKGSCQKPARRCQAPSQRQMTEFPF